ncbi:glucokinase [Dyella telluris]|uniref:Glucokinase n=1 Tax=Dyella telluris TaxID=2763498 RepID=A0A7G8Q390_9GAMM|nr:glucokinase [Dyella telluris]QNK01248.1 glucokinase [Dyella telluris]
MQQAAERAGLATSTFLAADVGGTHARIGLVVADALTGQPDIVAYKTYRCADHASLTDIVCSFCREHGTHPRALVLACAGVVSRGVVVNDNLAWPVVLDHLRIEGGFASVDVLNDFEAFAHAVGQVDQASTAVIVDGVPNPHGAVAVVGPGTGLGAALRLPGRPARVLHTEAGQMELAVRPGIEQAIRAQLGPADGYVSYEHVLSGPGVLRLYRALAAVHGVSAALNDPSEITALALAGMDPLASETVDHFCRWLGAFCGDVAMAFSASGGVCLAGGFLARLASVLRSGPFAERFLDKGVMRPFLNSTPVVVVEHGRLGVLGAANWRLGL